MEYKYFTPQQEGFLLKKPVTILYLASVIIGLLCAGCIYRAFTTDIRFLYLPAFFFLLTVVVFYLRISNKVIFQPDNKKILLKSVGKTKTYAYSDFKQFELTRVRVNGINTQKQISLLLNKNGKKKSVLLGVVYSEKSAIELIEEVKLLMM